MQVFRRAGRGRRVWRPRPSYANVAATLALVLALGGGTAWAAHHYIISSTHQIKPSVLKKLRGKRGRSGAAGADGTNGTAGPTGPTGPTGATGVPDTSNFYTKSESDSRFAPVSYTGELDVPGTAFTPIASTTTFADGDFFGLYETAGLGFLSASLQALPHDATITSVEFAFLHNSSGTVTLYLSQGHIETGGESYESTDTVTSTSASVQTDTLTPQGGFKLPVGYAGLLFWQPAATGSQEILYGARVFYSVSPS
jgi:hypothetical protein